MTTRITFPVSVNLDAIPGTFHTEDSAREVLQRILHQSIDHYHPVVHDVPRGGRVSVTFDRYNVNWHDNVTYTDVFIKASMSYMNALLHTQGYVFLNEVYETLGLPKTRNGATTGWISEPIVWDTELHDGFIQIVLQVEGSIIDRAFKS